MTAGPATGRVALITGGASGIGRETALLFALRGATVFIGDLDRAGMADAASDARAVGAEVECVDLDVREPGSIEAAFATIEGRASGPDIVVNCAGIAAVSPFLTTDIELFDRIMETNLRGAFLVGQAAARSMGRTGRPGAIVLIASASGRRGGFGRTPYGPSKAAVIALTQVMALEFAEYGIRVNGVAPGPIDTPLALATHTQAMRETWVNAMPMRRYGTCSDVAEAVLFLASEDAAFMTGHTIDVDGGFTGAGLLAL